MKKYAITKIFSDNGVLKFFLPHGLLLNRKIGFGKYGSIYECNVHIETRTHKKIVHWSSLIF